MRRSRAFIRLPLAAFVAVALVLSACSGGVPREPRSDGPAAGDAANLGGVADPTGTESSPTARHADTDGLPDFAKALLAEVNDTPWPTRVEQAGATLTVVTLDPSRAVTKAIGPAGGDVSLTAGGVTYTLHLPEDALVFETRITLSAITAIGALQDLPEGGVHGVDMQPHGLQLTSMAELDIDGLPDEPILGFAYSGAGLDLRPAPIVPDPDRTAVYVSHFSGAGVGPFAALGAALDSAGANSGPTAAAAKASAGVHNRIPGSTLDQVADTFRAVIDQLDKLVDRSEQECGERVGGHIDAYVWIAAASAIGDAQGAPGSSKAAMRGLVDLVVSCWGRDSCITPSPEFVRLLQGLRALLVRWNELDGAAGTTGYRDVSDRAYCSATGWVQYIYDDGDGMSITASLTVRLDKGDNGPIVIPDRSDYVIGERSEDHNPDCPGLRTGYGEFSFGDQPPGAEGRPEIRYDELGGDQVALMVGPVYYATWADCHGGGAGWETGLLLSCNPDGTGSDSLVGTVVPGSDRKIVSFECADPSMDAKTTGFMILDTTLDDIIPPELWN